MIDRLISQVEKIGVSMRTAATLTDEMISAGKPRVCPIVKTSYQKNYSRRADRSRP